MGQRVGLRLLLAMLLLLVALFLLPGCSQTKEEVKSGPDAPRHPPGVKPEDVNPVGGPDGTGGKSK